MKQDDNLLLILCVIGGIGDDERRSEQQLLLQGMRVHPESAGPADRKIETAVGPGADERQWRVGDAVVRPRRRQPVPMYDRRLGSLVSKQDIEGIARPQAQAGRAVGSSMVRREMPSVRPPGWLADVAASKGDGIAKAAAPATAAFRRSRRFIIVSFGFEFRFSEFRCFVQHIKIRLKRAQLPRAEPGLA